MSIGDPKNGKSTQKIFAKFFGSKRLVFKCFSYPITLKFKNFRNFRKCSKISKNVSKMSRKCDFFPKWKKNSNLLSFLSFRWILLGPKYVLETYWKFIFAQKFWRPDRNFCSKFLNQNKPKKANFKHFWVKIYEVGATSDV